MDGILIKVWLTVGLTLIMESNLSPASPDAKRLYDTLLKKNNYNKLIRPVGNTTDKLTVMLGLRLTQIIDVDEKNQIMTTNVWLEQTWHDYKLQWDKAEYSGVDKLYVPSSEIWLPDIVLYNSADGNFTVKLMTKATVHSTGEVVWKPPAIYKSLCPINVEFFPFDKQLCTLKIGSWTYDGESVDLKHVQLDKDADSCSLVKDGIILDDYASSSEWDILEVPAMKYEKFYPCCSEPYPDIKFNITIKRKTLFYTVNLILPCVAICSATVLTFYIPTRSGEKITMGITILNALNIFLLLVSEINPPTSIATPLIGKYLLFTMILVTLSIVATVLVLNIHFRSPSTHVMPTWIQELFLNVLPKLLLMNRPKQDSDDDDSGLGSKGSYVNNHLDNIRLNNISSGSSRASSSDILGENYSQSGGSSNLPPVVSQAMIGVAYIADHLKEQEEFDNVKADWEFVAMVLDRLFLWIFSAACLVGTFGIILQAPTLYEEVEILG